MPDIKPILSFIASLFMFAPSLKAQDNVFEKIDHITWIERDRYGGTTVVFYKTSGGLLKAIKQLQGSGVYIINAVIFDVEVSADTIYLLNGLDLNTAKKSNDCFYTFSDTASKLFSGQKPLIEVPFEESILYPWMDGYRNTHKRIDRKLLSAISIGKNEIYKDADLIKTLIDIQ